MVQAEIKSWYSAEINTEIIMNLMLGGEKKISLPFGKFFINNLVLPSDEIALIGHGNPRNFDLDAQGSTILCGGTLNLNGRISPKISNLGIDVREPNQNAILSSPVPGSGKQFVEIRNVSAIGGGIGHGISLTSGGYNTIENFSAFNFQHGMALRCGNSVASNLRFEDCSISSLTIKSVSPNIEAKRNIVTAVFAVGSTPAKGGPIVLEAFDSLICSENIVSNIVCSNVSRAIHLKTFDFGKGHGIVKNNLLSNIVAKSIAYEALLVSGDIIDSDIFNFMAFDVGLYYAKNISGSTTVRIDGTTNSSKLSQGVFDKLNVVKIS